MWFWFLASIEFLISIQCLPGLCFSSINNLNVETCLFPKKQCVCVCMYASVSECMSDFTPGFGNFHRSLYDRTCKRSALIIRHDSPLNASGFSFMLFSLFFSLHHSARSHYYIPLSLSCQAASVISLVSYSLANPCSFNFTVHTKQLLFFERMLLFIVFSLILLFFFYHTHIGL